MSGTNVRVICRFRPFNKREIGEEVDEDRKNTRIEFVEDHTVDIIYPHKKSNRFQFDKVFAGGSSQEDVYNLAARDSIVDVLNGYNGTIFAYGQTGAGKSWTMFGPEISEPELKGIIPRACSHIFDHINSDEEGTEYMIRCSFLEIYKEIIRDLLSPGNSNLKVRETKTQGVWVDKLTEVFVTSEEEVIGLLKLGEKHRATASTDMNAESSRSHSLFIINLQLKTKDGSTQSGRLNLADLAGSEKIGKTGATGETLEEAKKINLSLSALGNCIKALTSRQSHNPYRDSKLTWVLKESLGGNAKTTLLIACSAHPFNIDETVSTLRFGQRAKEIKNKVSVNKQRSVKELEAIVKKMSSRQKQFQRYTTALEGVITDQLPDFDLITFRKENFESRANSRQGEETKNEPEEDEITNQPSSNDIYDALSDPNIEKITKIEANGTKSAPVTPVNHEKSESKIQLMYSTPQGKNNLNVPGFDDLRKRIAPKVFNESDLDESSVDYYDPMALAESQLAFDKMKENTYLEIQDLKDDLEESSNIIKTLKKENNEKVDQLQHLEEAFRSLEITKEEFEFNLERELKNNEILTDQIASINAQLERMNETMLDNHTAHVDLLQNNEHMIKEVETLKKDNNEANSKIVLLSNQLAQINQEIEGHIEKEIINEKAHKKLVKTLRQSEGDIDNEKKKYINQAREFQVEQQLTHTKLIMAEQKIQFLEQKLRLQSMSTIEAEPVVVVNVEDPDGEGSIPTRTISIESAAYEKTIDELKSSLITVESELESVNIDLVRKNKLFEEEKTAKTSLKQDVKKLTRKIKQMELQNEIDSMKVLTKIQDAERKHMFEETKNMKLEKELEEKSRKVQEQDWKIKKLIEEVQIISNEKNSDKKLYLMSQKKLADQSELINSLQLKIKNLESNVVQGTNKGKVVTAVRSGSSNTFNFTDFMRGHKQTQPFAARAGRQPSPRDFAFDKRGYLIFQEESSGKKSWKRYYFTVKGHELCYYKTNQLNSQIGSVSLQNIETVERADNITKKPNSFLVVSGTTELLLRTTDEDACDEWMRFLLGLKH